MEFVVDDASAVRSGDYFDFTLEGPLASYGASSEVPLSYDFYIENDDNEKIFHVISTDDDHSFRATATDYFDDVSGEISGVSGSFSIDLLLSSSIDPGYNILTVDGSLEAMFSITNPSPLSTSVNGEKGRVQIRREGHYLIPEIVSLMYKSGYNPAPIADGKIHRLQATSGFSFEPDSSHPWGMVDAYYIDKDLIRNDDEGVPLTADFAPPDNSFTSSSELYSHLIWDLMPDFTGDTVSGVFLSARGKMSGTEDTACFRHTSNYRYTDYPLVFCVAQGRGVDGMPNGVGSVEVITRAVTTRSTVPRTSVSSEPTTSEEYSSEAITTGASSSEPTTIESSSEPTPTSVPSVTSSELAETSSALETTSESVETSSTVETSSAAESSLEPPVISSETSSPETIEASSVDETPVPAVTSLPANTTEAASSTTPDTCWSTQTVTETNDTVNTVSAYVCGPVETSVAILTTVCDEECETETVTANITTIITQTVTVCEMDTCTETPVTVTTVVPTNHATTTVVTVIGNMTVTVTLPCDPTEVEPTGEPEPNLSPEVPITVTGYEDKDEPSSTLEKPLIKPSSSEKSSPDSQIKSEHAPKPESSSESSEPESVLESALRPSPSPEEPVHASGTSRPMSEVFMSEVADPKVSDPETPSAQFESVSEVEEPVPKPETGIQYTSETEGSHEARPGVLPGSQTVSHQTPGSGAEPESEVLQANSAAVANFGALLLAPLLAVMV